MSGNSLAAIAFCWTIERRDGAGLALTSHDRDLTIGGRRYRAQPGIAPAAIEKSLGLGESDSEVAGAITSAALSEEDLAAGRWDGARVRLSAVDWEQPEALPVALVDGELGEIDLDGTGFRAGLRGAAAGLSRPVCPATSSECRAELGDRQCRVDMAGRELIAKVVAGEGRALTLETAPSLDFLFRRAEHLSGANSGLRSVIVAIDGASVMLRDLPAVDCAPGDLVRLRHGCDKMFATCRARFANAANFRGEPHLPGNDLLTRFPGG